MVLPLWEALRPSWGQPRDVRAHQPVMATAGPSHPVCGATRWSAGRGSTSWTWSCRPAAAMFTEEVGYRP